VDVLIPAAVENVLNEKTTPRVKAKMVVEGANGPTTAEGDRILEERGVVTVPDILANAGGVIASYIEWRNAKSGSITDREEVFESLENVIGSAYDEVMGFAKARKTSLRLAAQAVAVEEVVGAMRDRGWI
jgi:glutamate dehydrogenase (NAD(P)+)